MGKSREEHLQWCKDRAEEYLARGQVRNAYASFASDMQKHADTAGHIDLGLGLQLMMIGDLSDVASMRRFIEGVN